MTLALDVADNDPLPTLAFLDTAQRARIELAAHLFEHAPGHYVTYATLTDHVRWVVPELEGMDDAHLLSLMLEALGSTWRARSRVAGVRYTD